MIRYFKGDPAEYVMEYVKGKLKREGRGIAFFYWPRITTVVSVPFNTTDVPYVFCEITANFQEVTVQGQVTYRIADPKKVAPLLNYVVDPRTKQYKTEDPPKLDARIVNMVQEATREEIQRLSLEDSLRKGAELAKLTLERLKKNENMKNIGIEILDVFITIIRPTPEVGKALEADYREILLRKADQAIYARRAAAVEQSRKIRENELATEIALEEEREGLVDLQAKNLAKEAEAQAKAIQARLGPYKEIDPRLLTAIGINTIGENAEKITNLNITSDILAELLRIQGK